MSRGNSSESDRLLGDSNEAPGNVLYLGVARIAGEAIVIASYSYNVETDIKAVKQVLEQPNINLSPGKHYSFTVGELAWHLIADDSGLIYLLISQRSYPQSCGHMCLEELHKQFTFKFGDKAMTAKASKFDKDCAQIFNKICVKFDNLSEVHKLAAVSKKVETIKLTMMENVEMALKNCVQLESLQRDAEELAQQAQQFQKNTSELKNKLWWQNMWWYIRLRLCVLFIILCIVGVIVGFVYYYKSLVFSSDDDGTASPTYSPTAAPTDA